MPRPNQPCPSNLRFSFARGHLATPQKTQIQNQIAEVMEQHLASMNIDHGTCRFDNGRFRINVFNVAGGRRLKDLRTDLASKLQDQFGHLRITLN
ncbi:hypothetical protein Q8F55_006194 [Vanrija albida]|uniref:Uncharacterized protein n=1 Tax=Vanrija albida TaxID=181172 RepID=A0ABR3PXC9_9TREE